MAADEPRAERSSMLSSIRAVSVITLVSRVAGLARDSVLAHFLGTGRVMDALRLALLIPNLCRRLVGEGAVQAGVVPVFSRAVQRQEGGDESLPRLAEAFFTLWTIVLAVVTVAGIALSGALLGVFLANVSDWAPADAQLAVDLSRWVFVYLVFIGLSALAQGILNAFKVFALPSATPLVYNLAFICAGGALVSMSITKERDAVWAFAAAALVGGFLQFVILVPSLWRRSIRFVPRFSWRDPRVVASIRLILPATLGAGIYQINVLVGTLIATRFEHGVGSLYFSGRLIEVILGVFVFALSSVSLTSLSRQAESGDSEGFRSTLTEVLRLSWFITIPSAVGLLVLGEPIIELFFASGRFRDASVELTLRALRAHVLGLAFIGGSRVLVSAFYANKDVKTPVRVAVVNLVINVVLGLLLSMTALEHAGVALASSLAVAAQYIMLFAGFRKRHGLIDGRALAFTLVRAVLAAGVMGFATWLGTFALPADAGRLVLGAFVAVSVLGGAVLYFAIAWLLGATEVAAILGRARRGHRV